MTIHDEIAAARVEVSEAESALDRARDALRKLYGRKYFEECGLCVGSIVTDGSVSVVVRHIDFDHTNKPWVSGKLIKKDGTVGNVTRHLYSDWKVVTKNG